MDPLQQFQQQQQHSSHQQQPRQQQQSKAAAAAAAAKQPAAAAEEFYFTFDTLSAIAIRLSCEMMRMGQHSERECGRPQAIGKLASAFTPSEIRRYACKPLRESID